MKITFLLNYLKKVCHRVYKYIILILSLVFQSITGSVNPLNEKGFLQTSFLCPINSLEAIMKEISWDKSTQKWGAYKKTNGKNYNLGRYKNENG